MLSLRPYQLEAVERVRERLRSGCKRVVFVAPTGPGKTVIASHIIANALERHKRVLLVAHRRELIKQPFAKLIRNGIDAQNIGIIMAGVPFPRRGGELFPPEGLDDQELWLRYGRRRPGAPVQIASIDTLRNRPKPHADLIIIDECHRSLAKGYVDLLDSYPESSALGLTATPIRTDGRGLGEMWGDLVQVAQYHDLAELGFLVEPRVWTVPQASLPDLRGVKTTAGDFHQAELQDRCNREGLVGDLVAHYQAHGNGLPAFAFASGVEHSRHIAERFNAAGIQAAHLDGATPTAERDRILGDLIGGRLRVVSNCDVCTEGTDIPCVKTIIVARPTKSIRVYLQMVGRGSRPYQGRPFTILDHAGVVVSHGLPQDDRGWSLELTKQRAREALAAARTCLQCFAVVPLSTRICPECGYAFPEPKREPPKELDGELRELVPKTYPELCEAWEAIVRTWHELNAERDVPMLPGWCFHQFKEKYKRRPPHSCQLPALTPEQIVTRAHFEALKQIAEELGYSQRWVYAELRRGPDVGEIAI